LFTNKETSIRSGACLRRRPPLEEFPPNLEEEDRDAPPLKRDPPDRDALENPPDRSGRDDDRDSDEESLD